MSKNTCPTSPNRSIGSSSVGLSNNHSKRIWVRRNGQVATTIAALETDIIDDLKSAILLKFPTSLGKTCDPVDLVIKYTKSNINGLSVNGGSSNANGGNGGTGGSNSNGGNANGGNTNGINGTNGMGSSNTNGTNKSSKFISTNTNNTNNINHQDIIFAPDEIIGNIYSTLFPNGMTMNDAFLVEVNRPSLSEYPSSDTNGHVIQDNDIKSHDLQSHELQSHDLQDQTNGNVIIETETKPNGINTDIIDSIPSASTMNKQDEFRSNIISPSMKSSTRRISHSGNNGVLLLPRQFQLTQQSHRKDEDHDYNLTVKPFINGEPSPVSSTSLNGPELVSDGTNGANGTNTVTTTVTTGITNNKTSSNETEIKSKTWKKPTSTGGLSLKEGSVPKITVLIVEDNVINRKILEAFMRRKHIRCEVAKNGKEAVEKWRQGGFHLVLMDIQLPVMSGIQATKEIRRLEHDNLIGALSPEEKRAIKARNIPDADKLDTKLFKSPVIIVALTASSSSADKSEALAAGCNDFLTKPVNLIWLEQKTIEWGCMQALIDFEGWKNWVTRNDSSLKRSSSTSRSLKGRSRSRGRPRGRSRANETTAPTLGPGNTNEQLVSALTTGPT